MLKDNKKTNSALKEIWQKFFHEEQILSEKNGLIRVKKTFNAYDVIVGACFQSGTYITTMWDLMLKKIPKDYTAKTVLMIGLGGGGGINVVRERFPLARIVAVEYDPVMVEIAQRIVFSKIGYCPEVIVDDAKVAIKMLISQNRKFDVIISDIFNGNESSPLMYLHEYVSLIPQVLSKEGYLLANFYKNEKTIAPVFETYFSCWEQVLYKYNRMRIYRNFGKGNIGDPVADDFINKEQSNVYFSSLLTAYPWPAMVVGETGSFGMRYTLGPIAFEWYSCDKEPILSPWKGPRFVFWQTITQYNYKIGWFRNKLVESGQQLGFSRNHVSYWKKWTNHAQRHRRKWLSNKRYVLRRSDMDEFIKAYHASEKLDFLTRAGFIKVLRFHCEKHPENLDLFLVHDEDKGKDIAGLATVNYPDVSQSRHTISFMHKDAQRTSVGYGLIDNWYKQALEKKINWLDFGLIWKQGDPKEWKGYSKFKRQFNLHLIKFPRIYFKITLR